MKDPVSIHLARLKDAENRYLQAVISNLRLHRAASGVRLEVNLTGDSDVIWGQAGKDVLRDSQPWPEDLDAAQAEIDDFIQGSKLGSFTFRQRGFRFRYGNGGTLPIVRMGGKEYYCLIYREIHPIGWNIANGGSDSRYELLQPFATVERELREELLIFDFERGRRYVFAGDEEHGLDRPEHRLVRNLIQRKYPKLDLNALEEWHVPIKWLDGPDEVSVSLSDGGDDPKQWGGAQNCFLTITAKDFGIEIDRIAWINVDQHVVFMDGEAAETIGDRLVNAPIGLFEVGALTERFRTERGGGNPPSSELGFVPDHLFHDMEPQDPSQFGAVLDRFMADLAAVHTPREKREFAELKERGEHLRLCPVTRSLVERYERIRSDTDAPGPGEIFVSAHSADAAIADAVAEQLRSHGRSVFLARDSIRTGAWAELIDDALDAACHMVVVGSSLRNILSGWVKYEWQQFHISYHSDQKPNGRLVPLLERRIKPELLPRPLLLWQVSHFDGRDTTDLPEIEL